MVMFNKAKPIWLKGRARELNLQVGFRSSFHRSSEQHVNLRLTGSTLYRVFLNGRFIHYGPARTAHGWLRVDTLDLHDYELEDHNELAIEVAGYCCPSYYTLEMPSFLQAELVCDGATLLATGQNNDFQATVLTSRVQKVMRYSFQRTFSEVYELDYADSLTHWQTTAITSEPLGIVIHGCKMLPRELPIPLFQIQRDWELAEIGQALPVTMRETDFTRRFIHEIGDLIKGYPLEEIVERPFEALLSVNFAGQTAFRKQKWGASNAEPINLLQGEYALLNLIDNRNGFLQTEITALEDSNVYLLFDEKLIDGAIDIRHWENLNVIQLKLKASKLPYRFESFESYGLRYLQVYVPAGRISLHAASLREYAYPDDGNIDFRCSDPQLNRIFHAAKETYRQNTVDVFMDCPTRERAGWLCDTYFTAQAAQLFSGNPIAEKVFLENFILAESFPCLPEGMLPMCYPADHINGNFIPQWAMWFVIQLEGYLERDPAANIESYRALCYRLAMYFEPFRNEDGLLEKLEKWNFIEWSKANEWVQDVNYPTNMLYSRMLELIGTWYGDEKLIKQADQIRQTVIEQSFDGTFFIDNALRDREGNLQRTHNRSEVCQYYAFFFRVADASDSRFSELASIVCDIFGPHRAEQGILPEIAHANAFIGIYLRLELLLRWRRFDQVLHEVKGYFIHMAETTGTLWEHDRIQGSLNHGFASFAAVAIVRSLLGVQSINNRRQEILWDEQKSPDIEAEAEIGTAHGPISVKRQLLEEGGSQLTAAWPQAYRLLRL